MRLRLSQLRRIIGEEVQRTLREGGGGSYYTGEIKAIVDKLYDDESELGGVELGHLEVYYPPEGSDLRKSHGEIYKIDIDKLREDELFQKEYDISPYALSDDLANVSRTDDWREGAFVLPDEAGDSFYKDNKKAVDDAYNAAPRLPVMLQRLVPKFEACGVPYAIAVKRLLADKDFKKEYEVADGMVTRLTDL